MEKKIVAIIQARMGSSRLPKKVLKPLCGIPLLEIIVNRIKKSEYLTSICIATTKSGNDDDLEKFCLRKEYSFYRGSENDVLKRYYDAAKLNEADIIVRVTADDPLKDPVIIDELVKILLENNLDYVSNTIDPTFPEGLDIEVFTFNALKKAYNEAKLKSEREHVTPYIWKNRNLFNTYCLKYNENLSHYRWTIDKSEDLVFFVELFKRSQFDILTISYEEVINFIKKNIDICNINSNTVRNEGYLKSLREEQNG